MKKEVYMYDMNNVLVREFESTKECAKFFGTTREYINHNLKYCKKKRLDGVWYYLRRVKDERTI